MLVPSGRGDLVVDDDDGFRKEVEKWHMGKVDYELSDLVEGFQILKIL